jgi:Asp-tRNA(Asn)/Glu-tRNA(Gln) amidotransferase A subunit family amidase
MATTTLASTTDSTLCYITAEQAIAGFKARELSPVDLMHAVIARCESVNSKVNALTYRCAEKVIESACVINTAYAPYAISEEAS